MPKNQKSPKKTILLAEDETAISRSLMLKLQHEGFIVTVVNDGQAALEAVKNQVYDLIVLDLIMPVLDGWGVLQQLRDQQCTIPIIVASNLGQDSDIAKAKELGAVEFLIKSETSLAEIVKKIRSYLNHEA